MVWLLRVVIHVTMGTQKMFGHAHVPLNSAVVDIAPPLTMILNEGLMYMYMYTYNMYMCIRGSLHTSQISHLLLYPSLWLLVPGLSSQFLPYFPIQPAFEVSTG